MGYEIDVYNLNTHANVSIANIPDSVKIYNKNMCRESCPELYSYGVQKWWWGKYAYCLISPFLSAAQLFYKIFSRRRKYDIAIAFSGHVNDLSFVAKNFIIAPTKICWCHGSLLAYFAMCDAYPVLYKKIDKFVVLNSAGQKDIYPGHKFMYEKKIHKIYNSTFMSKDKCDESIVKDLKKKFGKFILMSARIDSNKSQDVAIKAVKLLHDMGVKAKIVFIGSGEKLEDYKLLAENLGLSNYCIFEGFKTNVQDYIAASYVNLLTSKWEGLPTVIIEAMALGKPCVMTNCDDGEVSGNGKYCKLVPVDDIEVIANSLYDLYKDKEIYKKYAKLSLERAVSFKPEKTAEKLKALFEEN